MSALYLKHFDLDKAPFQITPNPDFFFSGSQRGGILTALLHVACHEEGIVTAVAEIGSGKTLLSRLLLSRLPEGISSVYLANPCFNRDEIITAISRDLGLTGLPATTEENLAQLHQELLRRHAQGQRVLLVIDEAHAMPPESLEEVRLLSNLETDRHKLINIILFGQPELDTLLADRKLRQVRDRVIHRFELPPLSRDEAAAYIDHRLRIAGWRGGRLFAPAAMSLLVKASGGRARRINLLADKSLLAAYAEGAKQVEKRHVQTANSELHADRATTSAAAAFGWRSVVIGFSLGIAITILSVWVWGEHRSGVTSAPTPVAAAGLKIANSTSVPLVDKAPAPSSIAKDIVVAAGKISQPSPDASGGVHVPATAGRVDRQEMIGLVRRTKEVLENSEWGGFTLQLASLSSPDRLPEYLGVITRHVDLSSVYAHNRTYNGKHSAAVYWGHFSTEQEAREALMKLPEPLKIDHPIIRTWAGIRREPNP